MKKKATDRRKRLLKVQEALRRVHEEIGHFCSKCVAHIFKKIEFKDISKKLLEKIF